MHEAERVAERIQQELAQPVRFKDHALFNSASIGIVSEAQKYEQPEELLRDVDLAMYQAKAGGRARAALFDSSQRTQQMERWQLENDLRQALARQEIQVYYQPIVTLKSGRISRVEAFLRWQHPQQGLLSASQLYPWPRKSI
jgi:predicted signal transduction protein with EAL and GGDEF domain